MGARLITAPTGEPVELAEAKAHLRLEDDLDDATVTALITVARQWVESHCSRALLTQTWEFALDGFPTGRELVLPTDVIQSITSVNFDDAREIEQTVAATDYVFDEGPPPRLVLKTTACWPTTSGEARCIRIRFVAGYGTAAEVPAPIKQAILLLVSQMYEHRTPEIAGTILSKVEFAVSALLSSYRLVRF